MQHKMKSFGLERGEKATGIKHENALNITLELSRLKILLIKTILRLKNVLGVYKSESVEELENALKSQKNRPQIKRFRDC